MKRALTASGHLIKQRATWRLAPDFKQSIEDELNDEDSMPEESAVERLEIGKRFTPSSSPQARTGGKRSQQERASTSSVTPSSPQIRTVPLKKFQPSSKTPTKSRATSRATPPKLRRIQGSPPTTNAEESDNTGLSDGETSHTEAPDRHARRTQVYTKMRSSLSRKTKAELLTVVEDLRQEVSDLKAAAVSNENRRKELSTALVKVDTMYEITRDRLNNHEDIDEGEIETLAAKQLGGREHDTREPSLDQSASQGSVAEDSEAEGALQPTPVRAHLPTDPNATVIERRNSDDDEDEIGIDRIHESDFDAFDVVQEPQLRRATESHIGAPSKVFKTPSKPVPQEDLHPQRSLRTENRPPIHPDRISSQSPTPASVQQTASVEVEDMENPSETASGLSTASSSRTSIRLGSHALEIAIPLHEQKSRSSSGVASTVRDQGSSAHLGATEVMNTDQDELEEAEKTVTELRTALQLCLDSKARLQDDIELISARYRDRLTADSIELEELRAYVQISKEEQAQKERAFTQEVTAAVEERIRLTEELTDARTKLVSSIDRSAILQAEIETVVQ